MVSTRNHPTPLPAPSLAASQNPTSTPSKPPPNSTTRRRRTGGASSSSSRNKSSSSALPKKWVYRPHAPTILWLLFSLPLVIWDTVYIFLRPHTFPGGALYYPLYVGYKLYGSVDLVYSVGAYEAGMGFTAAQGAVNALETIGYLGYLAVIVAFGGKGGADLEESDDDEEEEGEGWAGVVVRKLGFSGTAVGGGWGGVACLCGFAVCVMTVSKTVLYCKSNHVPPFQVLPYSKIGTKLTCPFKKVLHEVFSSFAHIGHNDALSIIFLWIVPK